MCWRPVNCHSDSLGQSAGWGTEVGQNCQTPVYLCEDQQAPHHTSLTPTATLICDSIVVILTLCILLLMSVFMSLLTHFSSFPASQSPHPSLQCWIIETDSSSCSQLCVRVERDRKERNKETVGRLIHVLIEGFVKGLRHDVRCTSGIFPTLWE